MSRKALPILAILLTSMLLLTLLPVGGQTAAALSTAEGSQAPAPAAGTSEATEPPEEIAFQRTKEPVAWKVDPHLIDNLTSLDYPFSEVRFIIVCENEEAKAYVSEHLPSNVKLITYFRYLPFLTASVPKGTDPAVIYRIADMPGVKGIVADRMVKLQSLTAGDRVLLRLDETTGKPTIQQLPWPPKPSYFADYPWFLNETAELIGATRLWEMGITGEGVVVAVIDTGIWDEHPALEGKVIAEASFVAGFEWIPPEDPNDYYGHGTACASIIAGTGAPGGKVWDLYYSGKVIGWVKPGTNKGMAPGAKLLNAKVFCRYGFAFWDWVLRAMEWSVEHGADILSCSFGGGQYPPEIDPMRIAVLWAIEHGVVVVCAAGNAGPQFWTTISPAAELGSIAVGSITEALRISDYSSRGPTVYTMMSYPDILAPAEGTVMACDHIGMTAPPEECAWWITWGGTSFAAPHAAGAVALLLQAFPGATPAAIEIALRRAAWKLINPVTGEPYDHNIQGSGVLNVTAAYYTLFEAPKITRAISAPTQVIEAKPGPVPYESPVVTIEKTYPCLIESPHPYENDMYEVYTLQHPGAKAISVHFEKIDVEDYFDYVYIYDANWNLIAVYTGYYENIWTPWVPGDTVYIVLESDYSITYWGFRADKYAIDYVREVRKVWFDFSEANILVWSHPAFTAYEQFMSYFGILSADGANVVLSGEAPIRWNKTVERDFPCINLTAFDVLVIPDPLHYDPWTLPIDDVVTFVEHGGCVLIIGDNLAGGYVVGEDVYGFPIYYKNVTEANIFTEPFGIKWSDVAGGGYSTAVNTTHPIANYTTTLYDRTWSIIADELYLACPKASLVVEEPAVVVAYDPHFPTVAAYESPAGGKVVVVADDDTLTDRGMYAADNLAMGELIIRWFLDAPLRLARGAYGMKVLVDCTLRFYDPYYYELMFDPERGDEYYRYVCVTEEYFSTLWRELYEQGYRIFFRYPFFTLEYDPRGPEYYRVVYFHKDDMGNWWYTYRFEELMQYDIFMLSSPLWYEDERYIDYTDPLFLYTPFYGMVADREAIYESLAAVLPDYVYYGGRLLLLGSAHMVADMGLGYVDLNYT
ncbi:MAG TPA: hypothetical protein ENF34_03200, partial [Candidatus Bathyarchaeota archaeon]|nr:hypothetical protein [Candidatus Bathyarchaeota archaeon]